MNVKLQNKYFKNAFLLCFIIILFLLPLSNYVLFAQISHSCNFSMSDLNIFEIIGKDNVQYKKVEYTNLQYTDEIGKPMLPIRYVKLIIPSDQDVAGIAVTNTQKETLTLSKKVYPAQPDIPTSIYLAEPDFISPDPQIYQSPEPWPNEIVKAIHQGYFDGSNHIVTLAVCPFQYYPPMDRLDFFTTIDFTLHLRATSVSIIHVNIRLEKNQLIYDHILNHLVDNPQDISQYQSRPSLKKLNNLLNESLPPFYEYVIITSNELQPYFDTFVEWKKRKGLNIGRVTIEEIYSDYSGDLISGIYDNAGKLRQYLSDAYQSGTIWALLAGDHTIVPTRYGWSMNDNDQVDYIIPADLYFADFNGDWNVDLDSRWGEPVPHDYPDYNPEIFVGRLPCNISDNIIYWTEKVIKYEQYPGKGNFTYLINSFMIESDQLQQDNRAEYIKGYLPPAFFTNTTIWREEPSYSAPNPTFPTGAQVVEEINSHYGLISWLGHGAPIATVAMTNNVNEKPRNVVNTHDNYDNEVPESGNGLDCLTNSDYPSILYSVACDNFAFDDFDPMGWWPGRCLGEGFTVLTGAGGPTFLGNTRFGYVWSSTELYKKFAELITAGTNDPESGKSYLHL